MNGFTVACRDLIKYVTLNDLVWRHHGLGMLQGELSEDLRIHIWHPSLETLPRNSFRRIHDHRFQLESYVAVGLVTDKTYRMGTLPTENSGELGAFAAAYDKIPEDFVDVWNIKHAKIQDGNDAVLWGKASIISEHVEPIAAGKSYLVKRRIFHQTTVDELAITVVRRWDFDDEPARVLGFGTSAIVSDSHDSIDRNWSVVKEIIMRRAQTTLNDLRAGNVSR